MKLTNGTDTIDEHRQEAISFLIDNVDLDQKKFSGEERYCQEHDHEDSFACDAMMLGSLLKSCSDLGLWPPPRAPFSGRSLTKTQEDLQSITLKGLCESRRDRVGTMDGRAFRYHQWFRLVVEFQTELHHDLDLSDFA